MSEQIMACIDGSRFAELVCHYACWAGNELSAPLTFLHVLDRERQAVDGSDHSGNIGLGAREQLLSHLVSLDEQRAKVAREQGKLMLAAAVDLARADGVETVSSLQRHGELVETLSELEQNVRLMVVGKRGEDAHPTSASGHLGSNLERVLRAVHRPVLIATGDAFKAPKEIMFAFDNSASTRKGIQKLAASPLFRNARVHVVTVGVDSEAARKGLPWVEQVLSAADIHTTCAVREGDDIESVLTRYVEDNAIDMTVMGAYGHSRIRHLLVGSTTTTMIQRTKIPLLVLR
ncbi:universal stress protein [Larsenimonas rhizosphaerae]|uniref:Universal stress protein n=1 Tax=Larsenimonas rhizosphaerae TaxID=2944682 RepID=A0AA41ZNY2_9GAMM|nr:universal stress protein [Larsenimonas rhizosphaerae]MCX2524460.1 universal stress protein [Larsenimonas rhizosphaerae]